MKRRACSFVRGVGWRGALDQRWGYHDEELEADAGSSCCGSRGSMEEDGSFSGSDSGDGWLVSEEKVFVIMSISQSKDPAKKHTSSQRSQRMQNRMIEKVRPIRATVLQREKASNASARSIPDRNSTGIVHRCGS